MRRAVALLLPIAALAAGCSHRPAPRPAVVLRVVPPPPAAPACAEEGDSRERIRSCRAILWRQVVR